MSNLSQFFTQLGTDSALLEAYLQDPEGIMRANGITDAEIAAVMSGDKALIRQLAGDDEMQMFQIVTTPN
ncbi:hypothetical protein K8B83_08665 [Shewanella inventionis]|uniref:Extradiol ring-cleavage dioxygenase LigAB LigA subunit domain-containing protein n=1 Tax=Shewanella inventionis TaxID=1738770 RepID=A0ABQ1JTK1_9GAMM|nr:hypothetical protein [Shewanella inventionis]MCL1160125.1 hypothetical protein [Shewanella inventionis]UAL44862.1 hypothetical protein K8B83_08665 [Shewanella inventionis]GGB77459.1 hypothetical protein GCM10011607_42030 [Shewanella inventionis]